MFENVIADILSVGGVKGVYIFDSEGSLIEAESMLGDEEVVSALIADLFNKANDVLSKISSDSVELLTFEGSKDRVLVTKVGDVVLGVIADIKVSYGLLKIEVKKAAEKIAAMM